MRRIKKILKKIESNIPLFFFFMIYKISLEIVYWRIIGPNRIGYELDFNLFKYSNGFIFLSIIYLAIANNDKRKTSTFFLYFEYIIAFIPITVIYALANESTVFYNILSFSFLICILVVKYVKISKKIKLLKTKKLILFISSILIIFLFIHVLKNNGLPTLKAFNIYAVYDIRGDNSFVIGHYFTYILRIVLYSILPFLLAVYLYNKKYKTSSIICLFIIFFYLHQPHKTFLFSIPLIIAINYALQYNYQKIYKYFLSSISMISILSLRYNIFALIQSLIVRRLLFDSSYLRFFYFDFFSKNPKVGFSGTIIGKLIGSEAIYSSNLGIMISNIYSNSNANANANFLIEGYIRFGIVGIFISLMLFTIILKLIDRFANQVGNKLAILIWILPIYILNESLLISEMLFGFILTHIIITIFYYNYNKTKTKINKCNINDYIIIDKKYQTSEV